MFRTFEIVKEDFPRRKGGNGFSKVILESVVGKLEGGLLGAVGPQVAVHAPVHVLAVLVKTCK